MLDVKVYRVPMDSPDDVSGLKELFNSGELKPEEIVAILGKTEGNGCVNDFTRGFCTAAFSSLMAEYLNVDNKEIDKKIAFVMSGGTEGVMTPHATIFASREVEQQEVCEKGLAIGVSMTRDFAPEEIGTMVQVEEVAKAVQQAMDKAKIEHVEDVHFVQIKCPLLTSQRVIDAKQRGKTVITTDTYKSMGYSRAASALGVAL
ncbi:MAG: ring-opening amidohydrolase, partial [Christensenellaceae bacterium]